MRGARLGRPGALGDISRRSRFYREVDTARAALRVRETDSPPWTKRRLFPYAGRPTLSIRLTSALEDPPGAIVTP